MPGPTSGIFISYRRESAAAFANRLCESLVGKLGNDRVFIDIDHIEPGEDFIEVLEKKLANAVALIVVIGRDWLTCRDAEGNVRLSSPDDFVRLEVATALNRKVRVIPVLIDGAQVPSVRDLPPELASLSRRQAIEIDHGRFHQDAAKLIEVCRKLLAAEDERVAREQGAEEWAGAARPVRERGEAEIIASGKNPGGVRIFGFVLGKWVFGVVAGTAMVAVAGYFGMSRLDKPHSPLQAGKELPTNNVAPAAAPPARPRADAPAIAPPAQGSAKAVDTRVDPKDGLVYVYIPPGSFRMGCSPGDKECGSDEKPTHRVTITKGFWLGQTPVTQAAYQRVKGKNPSWYKGDNRPVERVTWNDAVEYCRAIGGRLPTEAEWEYAARAGTKGARYGDLDAIAWYSGNSDGQTHEVGQKKPNGWGLYDMLGNVLEWMADWYGNYSAGDQSDPPGASSGQFRVLRGGSGVNASNNARASYRNQDAPGVGSANVGFRCVRE
jgi:formylglycine-generating enzyme required for sulfatase activity